MTMRETKGLAVALASIAIWAVLLELSGALEQYLGPVILKVLLWLCWFGVALGSLDAMQIFSFSPTVYRYAHRMGEHIRHVRKAKRKRQK